MANEFYYNLRDLDTTLRYNFKNIGCNDMAELRYIKDIVNTRISMFRYPDIADKCPGLTSEILEGAIMFLTRLCFYYDKGIAGYRLMRYEYGNNLNQYLKPDRVNLMTLKGDNVFYDVPYEDIILVRDNYMDIPPFACVYDYLKHIIKIEKAMFKVLRNVTLPLVIVGPKSAVNQMKALNSELDSDKPRVIADSNIADAVKSFGIDISVNPLDIYILKQKYRNELVGSLGIYSADEKRERVQAAEVASQNDYVDFNYMASVLPRRDFAEAIGLTLQETFVVNYKEDAQLEADKEKMITDATGKKEGEPNATE